MVLQSEEVKGRVRSFWTPAICDNLFWHFVKTSLLSPPHICELIGDEKPGWRPRWSRIFDEDWSRGRRDVQALACVLARVSPRRETQVWPRRPSGHPLPRLAYPCFGWLAESRVCVSVFLCVIYSVRVCVRGCWKICYLERWILMTFVNSNTQSCPAVDKTEVFSACFEFI